MSKFPFTDEQVQEIIALYNQGHGSTIIGRKMGGYTHGQVLYALEKYGIERRPARGRPQKSIKIPELQFNLINGLVLGDGHMFRISNKAVNSGLTVTQASSHVDFLEWSQRILLEASIPSRIAPTLHNAHILTTPRTKEFTSIRRMWYPDGKKIVPRTLSLSPIVLAAWYIGDGTRHRLADSITLYTNDFTFCDCCFLQGLLAGTYSIYSKIRKHIPGKNSWAKEPNVARPTIYISKRNAKKMFKIMGPCPVPTFSYKWPDQ